MNSSITLLGRKTFPPGTQPANAEEAALRQKALQLRREVRSRTEGAGETDQVLLGSSTGTETLFTRLGQQPRGLRLTPGSMMGMLDPNSRKERFSRITRQEDGSNLQENVCVDRRTGEMTYDQILFPPVRRGSQTQQDCGKEKNR